MRHSEAQVLHTCPPGAEKVAPASPVAVDDLSVSEWRRRGPDVDWHPSAADAPTGAEYRTNATARADLLCGIAADLFVAEEPTKSFGNVLRRIAQVVDAGIHFQHERTPEGGPLRLESASGVPPEETALLAAAAFGAGLPQTVVTDGAARFFDRVQDSRDPDLAVLRSIGVRACACLPLQAGGRIFGAVGFGSTSRDRFGRAEARFIETAVDMVAASIDRKRLIAELRAARDAAEQTSRAKDNFLAALSHELRTPLNPILLLASNAAANDSLSPAVRGDFETIARHIALETRLIDDLLDLTRITHGKLSLVKQVLDAASLVREAIATVRTEIDDKAIQLSLNFADRPAPVRGDGVRLQQVFWNILKNAVKFTPQGGRIAVGLTVPAPDLVRIEFADTGIGLTPDELTRAFELFGQGEHANGGPSQFGGLGLGLAITRDMVALHAGRIEVVSAGRDQGACFIVELPLASGEIAMGDQSPESRTPHVLPHRASRPGVRILLVEDHQPTRQALLQLLIHRHYEVIAAAGTAEARAIATRKRFDLVISDIGLPDGSGYELMTDLRREFALTGIALTGYGSEQDLELARSAGFIAHLTKPVSIQALEAALVAAVPAAG